MKNRLLVSRGVFVSLVVAAQLGARELPLFKKFPALKQKLPHVSLGSFPTPIIKLDRLGAVYHMPHLYLKNDGMSGVMIDGKRLPGGNKVRKLEFLLADAMAKKAHTIMTVGDAGSNHALATVIYSRMLGLPCEILLAPQIPTKYAQRNLLLDLYFRAKIHYFPSEDVREYAINAVSDIDGVYYIPSGGSNAVGSLGFVNAAFELKEQIAAGFMPEPDYIYVTLGSVGTVAGLMLGLKAAGLKSIVVPVRVVIEKEPGQRAKRAATFFYEANALLHGLDTSFPLFAMSELEIDAMTRHEFVGADYAYITPEDVHAIKELLAYEGIKLEGTYTGKTFAALLHDAQHKDLSNKVVLFWDTFSAGDFADLIKDIDYKKLPKDLHRYFEAGMQVMDQGY